MDRAFRSGPVQGEENMSATVLFVDDEPKITDALKRILRREPYRVLCANSAKEALNILGGREVDVVVSDEKMPGMSGSDFLALVAEAYPETIRIVLTGQASLEAAIRAINEGGIYRFLTKPISESNLTATIRQALEHRSLVKKVAEIRKKEHSRAAALKALERSYPGITELREDASGTIIIDDVF
ncbi:response regulator [Desulfoglaeba alkanexedens ALDC]|uniref:Response regulator n=2 Tax=Desulfoglaeba alkanexedens TaxID=361111 RepID=A0A4P8L148_9BACT|nr:response regulator [Desulfoglaeba alkanexedens ALDC]